MDTWTDLGGDLVTAGVVQLRVGPTGEIHARAAGGKLPEQYVALYRVSTQRQGVKGLGLTAQRDGCRRFVARREAGLLHEFRRRTAFHHSWNSGHALLGSRSGLRHSAFESRPLPQCLVSRSPGRSWYQVSSSTRRFSTSTAMTFTSA